MVKKIHKKKGAKSSSIIKKLWLLLIVGIVAYTVITLIRLNTKYNSLSIEVNQKEAEIETAKSEQEDLINQTELGGSDEYIEEKARDLGMIKPDEKIYKDITK